MRAFFCIASGVAMAVLLPPLAWAQQSEDKVPDWVEDLRAQEPRGEELVITDIEWHLLAFDPEEQTVDLLRQTHDRLLAQDGIYPGFGFWKKGMRLFAEVEAANPENMDAEWEKLAALCALMVFAELIEVSGETERLRQQALDEGSQIFADILAGTPPLVVGELRVVLEKIGVQDGVADAATGDRGESETDDAAGVMEGSDHPKPEPVRPHPCGRHRPPSGSGDRL